MKYDSENDAPASKTIALIQSRLAGVHTTSDHAKIAASPEIDRAIDHLRKRLTPALAPRATPLNGAAEHNQGGFRRPPKEEVPHVEVDIAGSQPSPTGTGNGALSYRESIFSMCCWMRSMTWAGDSFRSNDLNCAR